MGNWFGNLLSNVFSNLIGVIIMAIIGIAIGWLRKRKWEGVAPVLSGLAAFALVGIILFLLGGIQIHQSLEAERKTTEQLNEPLQPDHIKDTLKGWLSSFGFGSMEIQDPAAEFVLNSNLPSGLRVNAWKSKQWPNYIIISANVIVADEHRKLLMQLSPKQQRQTLRDLQMVIDQSNLQSGSISLGEIKLQKRLPITNSLTEDVFIRTVTAMEGNEDMVIQTLLNHIGQ